MAAKQPVRVPNVARVQRVAAQYLNTHREMSRQKHELRSLLFAERP